MSEIQLVGREVFAAFAPVDVTGARAVVEEGGEQRRCGEESERSPQFAQTPIRAEQAASRRMLFERFNGQCAPTGCAVAELLDAAHLPGRHWAMGHNSTDDGILLRTALHRALDMNLIRLDEQLQLVWVDPSVRDLYGAHMVRD